MGGIYLITNLQLSSWISHPEERTTFYWATYVATWVLPAIGLWIAVHDRHRALLDVNAVLAIATLMTNKLYLGAARQPYDPIAFGVLLIAVAVGLRRWLASGADGSRNGFIAERILESEKERLGVVGTALGRAPGPGRLASATRAAAGGRWRRRLGRRRRHGLLLMTLRPRARARLCVFVSPPSPTSIASASRRPRPT